METIRLLDFLISRGRVKKVCDANNRSKLYEIKKAEATNNKKKLTLTLSSTNEEKRIQLISDLVQKVLVDDINESVEVTLNDSPQLSGMTSLIFS